MLFEEKLEITEIAGLALQVVGVMGKAYLKVGRADPVLYQALRAVGELADQYRDIAEQEKANTEVVEAITEMTNQIHLTAMSVGEFVREVIEENGLPIELMTASLFELGGLDNDGEQD